MKLQDLVVSEILKKSVEVDIVYHNKKPTNWLGRQNAAPLKFDPKPSETAFSAVFRTLINADWK